RSDPAGGDGHHAVVAEDPGRHPAANARRPSEHPHARLVQTGTGRQPDRGPAQPVGPVLAPQRGHVGLVALQVAHQLGQVRREAARAAAAPPKAAATPAGQAAPRTPLTGAATPLREVFGFVNAGNVGSGSVGYSTWQFNELSTVAYFGEHVNWDGTLIQDSGW